jgi:5-methylcytosine-specific restriction endonuclease McrA
MITCAHADCTNQFIPRSYIHRFCSARCRRLARGDQWGWVRETALERDNYECQECSSQERLQVHHRIPVCMGGESTLENVITLCATCHRRVHRSWAAWRNTEPRRVVNGHTNNTTDTRGAEGDRAA